MADSRHLGEIDKSRYLGNGLTDLDKIWQVDAYWTPGCHPQPKFPLCKNQHGGRPLPKVVYISVTVGRSRTGIVSCESERRGLFQENYFRLCHSTSGMDLWGDDAAFCQITLTSCYYYAAFNAPYVGQ